MKVEIIRIDGGKETFTVNRATAITEIKKLLGTDVLDTVNLRDGRVMFVDDLGYETKAVENGPVITLVPVAALKPVNPEATKLYHAICIPGTVHQIVGDVAIVLDADFAYNNN